MRIQIVMSSGNFSVLILLHFISGIFSVQLTCEIADSLMVWNKEKILKWSILRPPQLQYNGKAKVIRQRINFIIAQTTHTANLLSLYSQLLVQPMGSSRNERGCCLHGNIGKIIPPRTSLCPSSLLHCCSFYFLIFPVEVFYHWLKYTHTHKKKEALYMI